LDKDSHCPASSCCTVFVQGDPQSFDDVVAFGRQVDMITFEVEAINVEALKHLKAEGTLIHPDPETLALIQDKGLQKAFYVEHNIPSPGFRLFSDAEAIRMALDEGSLHYPFVQKLRRGGYDGRGVSLIRSKADMGLLLPGPSVVEDLVEVVEEISVIAARNQSGEVKCFPVAQMEFNAEANLVELLVCPSSIDEQLQKKATAISIQVINAFKLVGLLTVELFVDSDGEIWVNEVAPRPHNSGHHTIESIITSQYEQQLRAIFGFPLGSTHIKMPSAMINLLGEPNVEGPVRYEGLSECMREEGVKIHLYGKKMTRPFRKMGHVTILASTVDEARAKAELIKNKLRVTSSCKNPK
ncbi:MAG: ATP-grasp domain-containing protein, partial [Verrucomicrobiae bacterium]|nr:ATP-grasp domain-containing protein [Verrucomicrobiae bacterium]